MTKRCKFNFEAGTYTMNEQRRTLLKLAAFGGATFVAGKLFGNALNFLKAEPGNETYFQNFKVVEKDGELSVFQKDGESILVIDKDSFFE